MLSSYPLSIVSFSYFSILLLLSLVILNFVQMPSSIFAVIILRFKLVLTEPYLRLSILSSTFCFSFNIFYWDSSLSHYSFIFYLFYFLFCSSYHMMQNFAHYYILCSCIDYHKYATYSKSTPSSTITYFFSFLEIVIINNFPIMFILRFKLKILFKKLHYLHS